MSDLAFRLLLAVLVGLGCAVAGYCWRAMETARRQRASDAANVEAQSHPMLRPGGAYVVRTNWGLEQTTT